MSKLTIRSKVMEKYKNLFTRDRMTSKEIYNFIGGDIIRIKYIAEDNKFIILTSFEENQDYEATDEQVMKLLDVIVDIARAEKNLGYKGGLLF